MGKRGVKGHAQLGELHLTDRYHNKTFFELGLGVPGGAFGCATRQTKDGGTEQSCDVAAHWMKVDAQAGQRDKSRTDDIEGGFRWSWGINCVPCARVTSSGVKSGRGDCDSDRDQRPVHAPQDRRPDRSQASLPPQRGPLATGAGPDAGPQRQPRSWMEVPTPGMSSS